MQKPTLRNFSDLLTSLSSSTVPFTRYIFNSLFTTVATVLASILVCCLGAYGLVKHRPAGSNIIFGIVVAALSFSTHVTTIPNYLVVNKLGLVNTPWALIIPKIAVAYNFFLVKQFCEQLPDSILEAARIDGSGEFHTFNHVVLPIMKPALAVQAIFTFVASWNNYFVPALILTSNKKKTLPILIAQLRSADFLKFDMGQVYMLIAIAIMPVIIIYLFLSKFIVAGVALGGVKG